MRKNSLQSQLRTTERMHYQFEVDMIWGYSQASVVSVVLVLLYLAMPKLDHHQFYLLLLMKFTIFSILESYFVMDKQTKLS